MEKSDWLLLFLFGPMRSCHAKKREILNSISSAVFIREWKAFFAGNFHAKTHINMAVFNYKMAPKVVGILKMGQGSKKLGPKAATRADVKFEPFWPTFNFLQAFLQEFL